MESNILSSLKLNMLYNLDCEETNVWNWAMKNELPYNQLLTCLYDARLNSISRFLSTFLREFSTEEIFEKLNYFDESMLSNYCIGNNIKAEKLAKLKYLSEEENVLVVFVQKEFDLQRFSISEFPILLKDYDIIKVDSVDVLIDSFKNISTLKNYDIDNIMADLRSSNAHLFLSMLLRVRSVGYDSKLYYNILNFNSNLDKDSLLTFFEQWCIEGHLMHPTPKTKTGLSVEDIVAYAPEAKDSFKLELIAVPRDLAVYNSNIDISYDEYMKIIFKLGYSELINKFKYLNLSWNDYYVIPIHPYQYSYINDNSDDLTSKNLFQISSNSDIEAWPLISFRTLFLESSYKFIKLPINIQITSSKRHLSVRASHHAIYISSIISSIKLNKGLSDNFEFEKEEVSIHFSKYIGALYREGISGYLGGNTIAMPVATFYEKSPINNNRNIIDDILELYQKNNNFSGIKETAIEFFVKYVNLVTYDVIRLLTIYGIGLEAHLQNTIIVLDDFLPSKIIIRDAEAINVCLNRLECHFPKHSFFKNSWNVVRTPEDSQKTVMHSLIHSNIGQLIYYIAKKYDIEESYLWNIARDVLEANFSEIKQTHYCVNALEDEKYFFKNYTNIKSLFKMKIENREGNEFIYTKCNNPLHI